MRQLKLSKAFTLMESGPVVFVTTCGGKKNNVMTISWTMVLDFSQRPDSHCDAARPKWALIYH